MKNKINIFSDTNIKHFLVELLADYELTFINLNEVEKNLDNAMSNIIFLNNKNSVKSIDFKKIKDNFLILSSLENVNLDIKNQLIKIPLPTTYIKSIIESYIENIKIKFHDISIVNEKLTNIKNNSFCYLTKLENDILSHLIIEKQSTKKYIQENILNIKSTIQTNSLDSHLTRIRKKMNQINTGLKIQSKRDKLLITI